MFALISRCSGVVIYWSWVWKRIDASLAMHLDWKSSPKQFDRTYCKDAFAESSVDNSWTPSVWLHGSCFHWNHTSHVILAFFGHECLHMCKHTHTHTCTQTPSRPNHGLLKITRPQSSLLLCLPAAENGSSLFDCFRMSEKKLLWWLRTSVWSLCELIGCPSYGNHHLALCTFSHI